jgi:hypothetical protein
MGRPSRRALALVVAVYFCGALPSEAVTADPNLPTSDTAGLEITIASVEVDAFSLPGVMAAAFGIGSISRELLANWLSPMDPILAGPPDPGSVDPQPEVPAFQPQFIGYGELPTHATPRAIILGEPLARNALGSEAVGMATGRERNLSRSPSPSSTQTRSETSALVVQSSELVSVSAGKVKPMGGPPPDPWPPDPWPTDPPGPPDHAPAWGKKAPEPGTFGLMASGLLGMAWLGRRSAHRGRHSRCAGGAFIARAARGARPGSARRADPLGGC